MTNVNQNLGPFPALSWRDIGIYLLIAFLPIVAALALLVVIGVDQFNTSGVFAPIYLFGILAPTLGALVVARLKTGTFNPVLELFRQPIGVKTIALGITALVICLGGTYLIGGPLLGADLGLTEGIAGVAGMAVIFFIGGFTEEIGWRGTLQPALQMRMGVIPAVIVVGIIWGLWHLPIHIAGETPPLFIGVAIVNLVGLAIFVGWAYNATERVYAPALIHAVGNIVTIWATPAFGPSGTTTQLLLTGVGLWLIAIIVLIATRGKVGVSTHK